MAKLLGGTRIYGTATVDSALTIGGQLVSTVTTGTAPLSIASTTVVPNLNVTTATNIGIGTVNQIPYQTGTGITGFSSNLTYTAGSNTISIGPAGGGIVTSTITTVPPTGTEVAGTLRLLGSLASATNGVGGGVTVTTGVGKGTGRGGNFVLTTGTGGTPGGGVYTGNGGDISLISGIGNTGGNFTLTAGVGTLLDGGQFNIGGGDSVSAVGGSINLSGGAGAAGGDIGIYSGGSSSGVSGNVDIGSGGGAVGNGILSLQYGAIKANWIPVEASPTTYEIGFFNATPVARPTPTAVGTQAVLDSVLTALNSLGLVDSTALTNASVLTPAGADTQIQYNSGGVLAASASLSINTTLNTLNVGPVQNTGVTTSTITSRLPTTLQNPSDIVIAAQNSIRTTGSTSPGGALTLRAGNGRPTTGSGGVLSIISGTAGTTGNGGALSITAGNGDTTSGNGGSVTLQAGTGAFGGNVSLNAGDGDGVAGYFAARGGNFLGASGAQFQCGNGSSGQGGQLSFISGTSDNGGEINFTPGIGSTIDGSTTIFSARSQPVIKVSSIAGIGGASKLGFFNSTPVIKPTVSGDCAGNVALQNFLIAQAGLGLITNSTTTGTAPAGGGGGGPTLGQALAIFNGMVLL